MPGLMPSMGAGAPPQSAQDAQGAPPMGMGDPGPENAPRRAQDGEKQLYGEFLGNALMAVYGDEAQAERIGSAFQSQQPAEALATQIAAIVDRVASSGMENGLPIDGEMMVAAANSLAADLGKNLAQAVGAQPLSDEQVEAVSYRTAELLREQRDGRQGAVAERQNAPPAPPPSGNGLMPSRAGPQQPPG